VGVTVTRNFGPLEAVPLVTRSDWARVGRLVRDRIIERTLSGREVSGAAFAPYSAGYRRAKAAAGAGSTVNLMLSGEMLRAITVEPDDDGVTLAFSR
jgi:hypothetical protein